MLAGVFTLPKRAIMKIPKLFKKERKVCDVGTKNKENREDWLREALALIPKGSRILDAGAGELQYKTFCKHLDYVSQDFGKYDGVGDKVGLQTGAWDQSKVDIVSDITDIPVKDLSFDAVMCVEVFEHLSNPIETIVEFSRILKKGGCLVITSPFASLTHFAPYHFYSGFNRYFYEKWLPKNGFEIVEIKSNGGYFDFLAQELRRLPNIAEKYSKIVPDKHFDETLSSLLNDLQQMSISDNESDELLTFGYMVFARKK